LPPQDIYQQDYLMGEDSFPLFDYLQLLWFRRRLIIAVSLFVAVIGYIQVNQLKSVYTASSTLMVGVPENRVVDIEQVLTRMDYRYYQAQAEVEVLRSRGLAAKVIEKLQLLNYEEFNPSLRVVEESLFDFLKYLNPRTWIPPAWKKSVREVISGEVTHIPPTESETADRTMVGATSIFLSKLDAEPVGYTNVIVI